MKFIFLATVLVGSVLVVGSLSIAEDTHVSLSELEQELQAGAEKVDQPAKGPTIEDGDYTRYRMQDGTNNLILALSVMGAGLFSLFLVLWYLKSRDAPP